MQKRLILLVTLIYIFPFTGINQEKRYKTEEITFPSLDQLEISATVYTVNTEAPVILLCHQAGYNRASYNEIAPKLCNMGFNCISIDQRSGGKLFGKENQTLLRAKAKNLPTYYLDAEQDMEAAINYTYNRFGKQLIIWGSSYSSTLALKIASENDKICAVLAFSPGEYFGEKLVLANYLISLNKPCFITSSRKEGNAELKRLVSLIPSSNKHHFIPAGEGNHGSRALWEKNPDHQEYWNALTEFLETIKK